MATPRCCAPAARATKESSLPRRAIRPVSFLFLLLLSRRAKKLTSVVRQHPFLLSVQCQPKLDPPFQRSAPSHPTWQWRPIASRAARGPEEALLPVSLQRAKTKAALASALSASSTLRWRDRPLAEQQARLVPNLLAQRSLALRRRAQEEARPRQAAVRLSSEPEEQPVWLAPSAKQFSFLLARKRLLVLPAQA